MADINRAQIFGRLGKDPEIRTTQSGDKVASFSIATSERWKDKNTGEQKERTEWLNVVAWGNLAQIAERHLRKGNRVFVEGPIRTRKWQDQSGNDRYSTEIVLQGFGSRIDLIDFNDDGNQRQQGRNDDYQRPSSGAPAGGAPSNPASDFDLDEVPF